MSHRPHLFASLFLLAAAACSSAPSDDAEHAARRRSGLEADSDRAAEGALLWQERTSAGFDPTARVAASGARVFVAGRGPSAPASGSGWIVRGYDAKTGAAAWTDAVPGRSDKAEAVLARGDRVFAGGFVTSSTGPANVGLLRAYDARTGAVRWEDRFDYGSFFTGLNGLALADAEGGDGADGADGRGDDARGPDLFAVGRGRRPDRKTEWYVRAYDSRTGALAWQDQLDGGRINDAVSVSTSGGRVFAAGFTTDATASSRHFTVRAYDAKTGALAWQDRVPSAMKPFFVGEGAAEVASSGDRVVAVGTIADATGVHFGVRVYDAKTGALQWSDLVDTGGGLDSASSVSVRGGRVFVAGTGGPACSNDATSNCDWVVRAYDAASGALLWSKEVDRNRQDDQANVILACANRVVVAGGSGNDSNAPYQDWRVQVLSAASGGLLWDDVLPTPSTFAFPTGLAVAKDRLVVAGSTLDLANGTQNGDFLVRAHAFGADDDDCEPSNATTTR